MGYLKLFIVATIVFGLFVSVFNVATDNTAYMRGSVEYPDQIEPADKVDYGSNSHSGGKSNTITNTQTPEPDDQDEGYSEDNEDLESP